MDWEPSAATKMMEQLSEATELSPGYKLVPWSSWDQWSFVHDSLLSSSPAAVAAALRRVSAWRSRGCIPVPVDVTASIVEIQQKDPFFREGANSDALESDEMLAMLYCMAIMRLVNCFVEPAHKKTGRSISDLADAVGIPRMLVDIRHESSHRNLPSLRLVRLGSMKALDWLKFNYWEPQKNAIPDVHKEIRSRLRELTYYLKTKHTQKLSSQGKRKRATGSALLKGSNKLSSQIIGMLQSSKSNGSEKQISRISNSIARLYSSYPSEVVLVLLEYVQSRAPDFSNVPDLEKYNKPNDEESASVIGSIDEIKTIIAKLSSRRPRLLLSILKTVLEMIEAKESEISERSEFHFLSSRYQVEICHIKYLCSLVPWLLMNLKALKDSGQIGLDDGNQEPSTDKNAAPRVSLTNLLHKCLTLSTLGDKNLSSSVLLIAEIIGNSKLSEKLKKLPLLLWEDRHFDYNAASPHTESILLEEEKLVKKAADKLELVTSRLRSHGIKTSSLMDDGTDHPSEMWTVARSWIPCPIGMLPCSFGSTAVLPVLDRVCGVLECREMETESDKAEVGRAFELREPDQTEEPAENESSIKRLKQTPEDQILETTAPMEGLLLIDGVWRQVSKEEMLAIESSIRIFA